MVRLVLQSVLGGNKTYNKVLSNWISEIDSSSDTCLKWATVLLIIVEINNKWPVKHVNTKCYSFILMFLFCVCFYFFLRMGNEGGQRKEPDKGKGTKMTNAEKCQLRRLKILHQPGKRCWLNGEEEVAVQVESPETRRRQNLKLVVRSIFTAVVIIWHWKWTGSMKWEVM